MKELVKVATLAEELNSEFAEQRGLVELKDNGYLKDMKEMWCCSASGMQYDADVESVDGCETKEVRMAVWMRGRLYDSDNVVVYLIEGSWWAEVDENSEWCI
jgi:hypothetical protein